MSNEDRSCHRETRAERAEIAETVSTQRPQRSQRSMCPSPRSQRPLRLIRSPRSLSPPRRATPRNDARRAGRRSMCLLRALERALRLIRSLRPLLPPRRATKRSIRISMRSDETCNGRRHRIDSSLGGFDRRAVAELPRLGLYRVMPRARYLWMRRLRAPPTASPICRASGCALTAGRRDGDGKVDRVHKVHKVQTGCTRCTRCTRCTGCAGCGGSTECTGCSRCARWRGWPRPRWHSNRACHRALSVRPEWAAGGHLL